MSAAGAVREDRLWQRHVDMAKLGGTPKGGVNRQALSPEDAAARNLRARRAMMARPCRTKARLTPTSGATSATVASATRSSIAISWERWSFHSSNAPHLMRLSRTL